MTTDITIPPEALEDMAESIAELRSCDMRCERQRKSLNGVSCTCAERALEMGKGMLRNWPGFIETHTLINAEKTPVIILPLPQETKDD